MGVIEMNTTEKHLNAAIAWLNRIYVNAENVDYMAMARQEIREAQELARKESKTEENKNTEE